jgi:hypothetical protein
LRPNARASESARGGVRFRDGTCGEMDLGSALQGPIMEPLKDVAFFK